MYNGFKKYPLSLLWLMFCASNPTFHLFCGFKYPPSCFFVCWKIKMEIRSMEQVNFVNSSIHYSGLKYPPSCFSVYLENKNAYLKQETSEIVVKSIHHGGLLFNCIIINLKSSENKERWRLSTVSNMLLKNTNSSLKGDWDFLATFVQLQLSVNIGWQSLCGKSKYRVF